MQDESYFFQFLLNSNRHAVVLNLIGPAIHVYHNALHAAVSAHDIGRQQDIALITRFLKTEAADRVGFRQESLLINSFERLYGDSHLAALLDHQKLVIADLQAEILRKHPGWVTMESAFENAGLERAPSWGRQGSANVGPQTKLRVIRHEVFNLTREMHRAYSGGNRQESWQLKQRADAAQKRLGEYAEIAHKSCALRMIKTLHGDDHGQRVLDWAKTHTRLSEYMAIRNDIQAIKFGGRIFTRSGRNEQRHTA